MKPPQGSIVVRATATDDDTFRVVQEDMWFLEVDVFVFDHDTYFGDVTEQDIDISAGDVYDMKQINLKDLIFKNLLAGSNTRIVCSGTLMTIKQMRELGVS